MEWVFVVWGAGKVCIIVNNTSIIRVIIKLLYLTTDTTLKKFINPSSNYKPQWQLQSLVLILK